MIKAPTIYQVAERAGVSISTVSNALNRPDKVSSATREKVLRAADDLGFVPKSAAVVHARKGQGRIGVLAPFSSYPSYLRRLTGVMSELRDDAIEVTVYDIESAATATSPVLAASAIRGRFDGLIVMGERIEAAVEDRLSERGMPTVVVDAESDRFSVIRTDDLRGGALAARHLYDLGHRQIGYLLERQVSDYQSQARSRLDGFTQAIAGSKQAAVDVVPIGGTLEEARAAARKLLDGPGRPSAIMAHFDDLAVGAIQAALELGLRIPEDVSVMGFDDGPVAEACRLTTVRQPFEESGALAASRLLAQMSEERRTRTVTVLDCELVARTSTAALDGEVSRSEDDAGLASVKT